MKTIMRLAIMTSLLWGVLAGVSFAGPPDDRLLPPIPLMEIEGMLELYHADYDDHGTYLYQLQTSGERLGMRFLRDATELPSGTRVRIKGRRLDNLLAVDSGSTDVTPLALTMPLVSGPQPTLVLSVQFSDKNTTFTTDALRTLVFTTVSQFDQENAYGQAWLTGDVVGPLTIALSSTVCDYLTLASQAKAAASLAGTTLADYRRFVYVFPKNFCGWWGLSTVGGNPSQSWINGNPQLRVLAHELGHGFGLYHSHSLDCGLTVMTPPCMISEYGDTTDVMGTSVGHFNSFQKERLGWLNASTTPPITTVLFPGQYSIGVYELPGLDSKTLKILKSIDPATGKKAWYYVEFRQPVGFDSWISANANLNNGVVIHTGSESSANSSALLDMTPGTISWSDPALIVGQTFQDETAGVTLDLLSINAGSALLAVTVSTPACIANPPHVTVSSNGIVSAGATLSYAVTVTNADSLTCAPASFTFAATPPLGWASLFAPSAVTVAPGSTGISQLMATSTVTSAQGTYMIPIIVTQTTSNLSTTVNAIYTVGSSCGNSRHCRCEELGGQWDHGQCSAP